MLEGEVVEGQHDVEPAGDLLGVADAAELVGKGAEIRISPRGTVREPLGHSGIRSEDHARSAWVAYQLRWV